MVGDNLIKLNFAPGIKAKDINHNFDVVHEWLNRERRRVGGAGIVDGFDLSANLDTFTITVGSGTIVNDAGEEIVIPEKTFLAGPPEYVSRREKFMCPPDGVVTLSEPPYSPGKKGHIDYFSDVDGTSNLPSSDEFDIYCESESLRVYYTQIEGSKVYVSHSATWLNKDLTFNYFAADDRVDAIVLYPDGTYKYQKSIVSNSPSHVEIADYPKECMLVGVIHWIIGTSVSVEFYTNHRTYRNVYVNGARELFLNGKPYRPSQMIYFDPPEHPKENEFWYDTVHNVLMVWRESYGDQGWIPVNDSSHITIKEKKLWRPETWPADSKTFLFRDDETNLRYVPNTNALEIVIDNCVLMSDQYEEIVSAEYVGAPSYVAQGIGFKLKDPLDRPTYVEVTVSHQVKSKPVTETFQRAAVFVNENYAVKQEGNVNQIFETEYPYAIGANQLEVWLDGVRLVPQIEFVEMLDADTQADAAKHKNRMSNYYRVTKPVATGQTVSYRINKHVWSYDQIAHMIGNVSEDIEELKARVKILERDLSRTNAHVAHQLDNLASMIDEVKDTKVGLGKIGDDLNAHIVGEQFSLSVPATSLAPIQGATSKSFILVHLINGSENKILVKGIDFTLADTESGLRIDLSPEYMLSSNTVYIVGFKMGV